MRTWLRLTIRIYDEGGTLSPWPSGPKGDPAAVVRTHRRWHTEGERITVGSLTYTAGELLRAAHLKFGGLYVWYDLTNSTTSGAASPTRTRRTNC